jgi:hypothetical protein
MAKKSMDSFEILADDLFSNSIGIAQLLGVDRSTLWKTSKKGKSLPSASNDLSIKLQVSLTGFVGSGEILPETTALKTEMDINVEKIKELELLTMKLRLIRLNNDLNTMKSEYEKALKSYNNIQHLLQTLTDLPPATQFWLKRQLQACENFIIKKNPGEQRKLTVMISGVETMIKGWELE